MAESSNTIANVPESSPTKKVSETDNNGDQSPPKNPKNNTQNQPMNDTYYDFYLKLRPTSKQTLLTAFAALSDTHFNPTQTGLMHVSPSGLSITVKPENDEHVFVFLCLKASTMMRFECKNTVTKVVDLEHLHYIVRNAGYFITTIVIYVLRDSNQLCFEFCHGDEPKIVDIVDDINLEYENHPLFRYAIKSNIPLSESKKMFKGMMKIEPPEARPHNVRVDIKSTVWRISTGTRDIIAEPGIYLRLQMTWRYWETLEKAAELADGSTLYVELGTNPEYKVILRLKLLEVGDMYFLQTAVPR